MDGENNRKPYEKWDDLGVKPHYLLETPTSLPPPFGWKEADSRPAGRVGPPDPATSPSFGRRAACTGRGRFVVGRARGSKQQIAGSAPDSP